MLFFQQAGRQHHGRHGHGDIGRKIREQLFRHHAPGRAAGRGHERLLLGHLAHKILGFFNGTQVRADGDLHHIVKAQELHGWLQLFRCHVRAELAHKGRSHGGDDTVALVDGLDDLEDLAFVRDGAERTVYKAHAAGHALVVIDFRAAQLVGADGIHAAGLGAGAFHLMDGAVGAYVGALPALDALALVDNAFAVHDGHRALGTYFHAGMCQAALAHIRHVKRFFRAGVAGEFDDIDEGRLIVFLRPGGLLDTGGKGRVLVDGAQRQTHGQAQALAHDGALQKDTVAVFAHLARQNLVRQLLNAAVIAAFVCHTGHLGEYLAADVGNGRINTTHV